MLPTKYRRIVGFNLVWECFASSLPQLALNSSRQVLNRELDITGDDNVQEAASTFVKAIKKLDLKRHIDAWKTPAGFPSMKCFHWIKSPIHRHIIRSIFSTIKQKTSKQVFGHFDNDWVWTYLASVFYQWYSAMRLVWSKRIKHFPWKRRMCRVFWSTVWRWRDSGIPLRYTRLHKADNTKLGLKYFGDGVTSVTVDDISTLGSRFWRNFWLVWGGSKNYGL